MVHTPVRADILAKVNRLSKSASKADDNSSTSTYKSGYIPIVDNGSSSSSHNDVALTTTLEANQGGSEKNLDVILHAISSLGERIKHLE